jgi:hypothetical protein
VFTVKGRRRFGLVGAEEKHLDVLRSLGIVVFLERFAEQCGYCSLDDLLTFVG